MKNIFYLALILFFITGCDRSESCFNTKPKALEWQTDEPGKMTWQAAMDFCQDLALNDKTDWRLPDIDELQTILDRSNFDPAADKNIFSNIQSAAYWANTTNAYDTSYAWFVSFSFGYVANDSKSSHNYVRCVRNGQ